MEQRDAFIGTLSNFGTRLIVCFSFVLIIAFFPQNLATPWGLGWGMSLLAILSFILARHRNVSAISEVGKHLGVATVVILVSKAVGHWIAVHII